jgi:hypothetical protein
MTNQEQRPLTAAEAARKDGFRCAITRCDGLLCPHSEPRSTGRRCDGHCRQCSGNIYEGR